MKKEVVEFICDNCHAPSEDIELTENLRKKKVFFPIGWIGLFRISNMGPGDKLLLCAGCDKAINDALKRRQRSSKHIARPSILLKGEKDD